MSCDSLFCGEAVWWQFHHEGGILAFHQETTENLTHYHGHEYAHYVKRDHNCRAILQGEEGSCNHDVNGQTRRTTHHGQDEHRYQSASTTFDGACSHYRWHVTAKTHNKGYERFAVQPHLVHQLIHDEGRASHIAAIFHERDEEVEDENLR